VRVCVCTCTLFIDYLHHSRIHIRYCMSWCPYNVGALYKVRDESVIIKQSKELFVKGAQVSLGGRWGCLAVQIIRLGCSGLYIGCVNMCLLIVALLYTHHKMFCQPCSPKRRTQQLAKSVL
jgi:hypothetical protein